MRAVETITVACWGRGGEWLGDLQLADDRGEMSLIADDGGGEISISESGRYALLFRGTSGLVARFSPPVSTGRVGGGGDLFGVLDSHVGLGALPICLEADSGEPLWRRTLRIRPAKFREAAEFEIMVEEICAWKTALALDMRAHSSAPWSLVEPVSDMAPEEELAVLRAASESEKLFEGLAYVERNAHSLLQRDDTPGRLGEGAIDPSRFGPDLARGGRRFAVPPAHPLYAKATSLPAVVPSMHRIETIDTPVNRFAKFVAISFRDRIAQALRAGVPSDTAIARWGRSSTNRIDRMLASGTFAEVGPIVRIDLGDPALQRRRGYRSILRAYLAARSGLAIAWSEMSGHVYAETRDVPQLYEFWCLIRLRRAIEEQFGLKLSPDHIVARRGSMALRRGSVATADRAIAIGNAQYHVKLWYNRTFSPTSAVEHGDFSDHSGGIGTWSKLMKPDFTIELLPVDNPDARRFIHLDAKYRLKALPAANDLDAVDRTHAADDIDKMHAYLSGIATSVGAHVLYPGDVTSFFRRAGSREAVGAIATAPGRMDDFGDCLRIMIAETVGG